VWIFYFEWSILWGRKKGTPIDWPVCTTDEFASEMFDG
jgi:hypothetical protein